ESARGPGASDSHAFAGVAARLQQRRWGRTRARGREARRILLASRRRPPRRDRRSRRGDGRASAWNHPARTRGPLRRRGRAALEPFGDAVAWLGSDRSTRERYRAWLSLREGRSLVAVGGRATVYAPVRDLGLVIVDDEAHVSYKER